MLTKEYLKYCDVNVPSPLTGKTALHYACSGGCIEIVKLLVEAKADIEAEVMKLRMKTKRGRKEDEMKAKRGQNKDEKRTKRRRKEGKKGQNKDEKKAKIDLIRMKRRQN